MSDLKELLKRFERFEQHQFPGFPDTAALQEAWDELVEQGGRLTALIQRKRAGSEVRIDELPRFAADLEQARGAPEFEEFRSYRAELEMLLALLRPHCC